MIAHEDDGDFIVYDTAVDENDQIILEDGTDIDSYIRAIATGTTIELGFSGTRSTFDNAFDNFDLERV